MSPASIRRALEIVGRFVRRARALHVERIRLGATSAVRDAVDPHAFLDPARELVGSEAEVITGEEEARLSFLGGTRGLDGAVYGFAVETGLHLLRIIVAGVFDRFPKLRIAVGHLGEGLPFFLFRIDYMHRSMVVSERYPGAKPLKKKPSDYLKENVWVTTSGMQWAPAILFCQQVLGVDRVMYALDYPYQFVPEEVKVTDELPISAADREKLYRGNAERVFKL